jgi:glutamine synthetase
VYAARHLPSVPRSLPEAIGELEASAFARKAFGDEVVEHLLHFARTEGSAVEAQVSDVERARYFERI